MWKKSPVFKIKNVGRIIAPVLLVAFIISSFFVIPRGGPESVKGEFGRPFGVPELKAADVEPNACNWPQMSGDGWMYYLESQTLTKQGSPYCISRTTTLPDTETLIIEPGAIIKFDEQYEWWGKVYGVELRLEGTVHAQGTSEDPIIFTSIKDDSYGGDTNLDGDLTFPVRGEWRNIGIPEFNTKEKIFDWVVFKYGGSGPGSMKKMFNIGNASDMSFTNCEFSQSGGNGIEVSWYNFKEFKNNKIYDNARAGVVKWGRGDVLDARYNWWGSDLGPLKWGEPQEWKPGASYVEGFILYDPWLGKENIAVEDLEPVILIPGIMGSWKRDVTWIDPYTGLVVNETKYVPDPILQTYDNLWQALINAGYQAQVDLYAFGYNWRDYDSNNATLLKEKIQEVKDKTGKNKVDLVVHSMGGIVARAYIQSFEYADDVDQLIFLGTPHLGSLNAYIQYEAVEGFEDNLFGWLTKRYFEAEAFQNFYSNLVMYVHEQVPALRELLPIYRFLKKKLGVGGEWIFREYPIENYVQNTFLENLNLEPGINKLKYKVQITNIVSDYAPEGTIVSIRTVPDPDPTDLKWIHGYPENYDDETTDQGLERGSGDHTVPMTSADGLPGVPGVLCEDGPIHRSMPTECQRHVAEALLGIWPDEIYRANLVQKLLMIYVHSPVEFQVVDEQGNITGHDFESDGYLEDFPNSLFDDEYGFVFIQNPGDGEYKINVLGIESGGDYELVVNNINDSGGQESFVSGTIATDEVQNYQFDYDNNSTEPVIIEEVQEEVTIDSVIEKIEDVIANNGFKCSCYGQTLIKQLKLIKSWKNKIDNSEKSCIKEFYQKLILKKLGCMKKQLKWWLERNRINQESYDMLINDFNFLIQYYETLGWENINLCY